MKKWKFVLLLLIIIAIALKLLYIYLVTELDPPNNLYDDLLSQIHAVHNENLELEDELLHDEAYTTIYQEAVSRGFVPGTFMSLP
jgi:hypothetical protein